MKCTHFVLRHIPWNFLLKSKFSAVEIMGHFHKKTGIHFEVLSLARPSLVSSITRPGQRVDTLSTSSPIMDLVHLAYRCWYDLLKIYCYERYYLNMFMTQVNIHLWFWWRGPNDIGMFSRLRFYSRCVKGDIWLPWHRKQSLLLREDIRISSKVFMILYILLPFATFCYPALYWFGWR